jgi:exosortase/archaeosortase
MNDELDPDLTRLFAQAREPLADGPFMANLLLKIERARRARMRRQIFAIAAVAVIVAFNMRRVLEAVAGAVRFVGDHSPAYTQMLITPWGWAASMLVGVWVVLRFRPSRR